MNAYANLELKYGKNKLQNTIDKVSEILYTYLQNINIIITQKEGKNHTETSKQSIRQKIY